MKLLITGASGFIGRNLAEHYAGLYEIATPDRAALDLLDAEAVRGYLERHNFDAVIHAATTRSNRGLPTDPELLDRNCRMFFNLARNTDAFGRMLFLSSGAVYDRTHWQPLMREEYFDAHVPADPYGFSKYLCAKAIEGLDRVYELRLFGVFGPHEDWRVRFLSNACCRAVWDMPIVIRHNTRFDYLDVADLARILECFLRKNLHHRQYNICSGGAVELRSLAAKVVEVSGKKLDIEVRSDGLGTEYSGCNHRLTGEIPSFRFTDQTDSTAALYRWYDQRKAAINPALLRFDE